uniref:Uncharacterized protein n=1 Tax=Rhizophora mucronata TaxID=61149 RepID=A0A2P2PPV6_RHIMU
MGTCLNQMTQKRKSHLCKKMNVFWFPKF